MNSPENNPSTAPAPKPPRVFTKILALIALLPLALFAAIIIYLLTPTGRAFRTKAMEGRTQLALESIASAAQMFHTNQNRWPANLNELKNTADSRVRVSDDWLTDAWGRHFVYTAPSSNAPGRIETFGADGNPAGNKNDGDAAVTLK